MSGNSTREQILFAVMAAVRAPVESLGTTLYRLPTVAISWGQCPAPVVFPESGLITERANDRVTRELTVHIVVLTRAVSPTTPETEADRLLTTARAALLVGRSLDDLALDIRKQEYEWDVEDADAMAATILAHCVITYRMLDTDLSTKG